jgi:DNA-binding MarR family transcriptional regulator
MSSSIRNLFQEQLLEIDRIIGMRSRSDATCCGVTLPQCHTLMTIGKNGPMPLKQLAAALGLDKSTLSRTVDGLVTIGLLERTSSPDDRRSVVITLSENGKKVFEHINATWQAFCASLFSLLPRNKQAQVTESLGLIISAINANHATSGAQCSCKPV